MLDNLTMLNAPKATVVRDGKRSSIDAEELVVDDIVIFKAGAQVCADAQVCAGEVQVNESLLTGESDEITKRAGDQLMSGSFIISGQCHARLDKVGEDSYISKLTLEAKEMQNGEQSEMIRSLDKLVKCVGVAIIPIGIILVAQSRYSECIIPFKYYVNGSGCDRNDSGGTLPSCKRCTCCQFNSACTAESIAS